MERFARDVPFPNGMQGRWTDVEDPASQMIIQGGEVTCFGKRVDYDYKLVGTNSGALIVSLKIDDEEREDTFQRANITELV